jgi:large subunit ribosomal protein L25
VASHDLKVSIRRETGSSAARRLRRAGSIPAVAYGHKEEPVKLALNAREIRDILAHGGSHGLLTLKFEGGSAPDLPVIIKSLQRNPVHHTVDAVDFLRVSLDEEVTVTVPIVLEGEPVGVKQDGGILVQALHELQITAKPQALPEHIVVDVSALEFNGAPILVSEVALPPGVQAVTDGGEAIAVVNPPDVEPEAEAPEEGAEPEIVGEAGEESTEEGES